jgi:hypothetical protein
MRIIALLMPQRGYGARRIRLISKNGNNQYYKGNRSGSTGILTPYGQFIPEKSKIRDWVIPDLTGFELRPYVARTTWPVPKEDVVRDVKGYIEAAVVNDASRLK